MKYWILFFCLGVGSLGVRGQEVRLVPYSTSASLLRTSSEWKVFGYSGRVVDVSIRRKGMEPGSTYRAIETFWSFAQKADGLFIQVVDTTLAGYGSFEYTIEMLDTLGRWSSRSPAIYADNFTVHSAPRVSFTEARGLTDRRGIRITWRADQLERVRSVAIFKSLQFDSNFFQIAEIPPGMTEFVDPDVETNEAYYYFVALRDIHNELVPGVQVFGISSYEESPAPPGRLSARPHAQGVELHWIPVDAFTKGFEVSRCVAGDTALEVIMPYHPFRGEDTCRYIDSAAFLRGGNLYQYVVRTINDNHTRGIYSTPVFARCGRPAIDRPTRMRSLTMTEDGHVHLFWDDLQIACPMLGAYRVYRRVDSGDWQRIGEVAAPGNDLVDADWPGVGQVSYRVEPVDLFGMPGPVSAEAAWPAEVLPVLPPVFTLRRAGEQVILRWEAPSAQAGVRALRIYTKGVVPGKLKPLGDVDPGLAEYILPASQFRGDAWIVLAWVLMDQRESGYSEAGAIRL